MEVKKKIVDKFNVKDVRGISVDNLARFMHERYEELSTKNDWETQEKCKVDFDKLPKENKKVMLELACHIIDWINNNQERI